MRNVFDKIARWSPSKAQVQLLVVVILIVLLAIGAGAPTGPAGWGGG